MTTQDINWKMFTYSGIYTSWDIEKPFVKDGYRYATDGRIAVRVPVSDANSEGTFPRVDTLGWLHGTATEWSDWPLDSDDWPDIIEHPCDGCEDCGYTGTHYDVPVNQNYPLTKTLNVGWLYAKRIALLPNPTFAIVEPERYDHPIVLFRFGENGEGILMPLGEGG